MTNDSRGRSYIINPLTEKRLNQHIIPLYIRILDVLNAEPYTVKEIKKILHEKGKRVSGALQRMLHTNKIVKINDKWSIKIQ